MAWCTILFVDVNSMSKKYRSMKKRVCSSAEGVLSSVLHPV